MKNTESPYHGHRLAAVGISRDVRRYFRFPWSLLDNQELLFERGVEVRYATVHG